MKKFFDDLMIIEDNKTERKYRIDDDEKYMCYDSITKEELYSLSFHVRLIF